MAGTRRLTNLVSVALPQLDLPDGPVAVALSGGADSATLALLTLETGRQANALHIDHQLPGSPMMRKAAVAIASRLGIELRIEEVEVGDGPSPEEQARVARYSALTRVESTVVTGHTRDDSAETMLINLVRGTGSPGLTGIPRFRPPNVYRPILALTRGETREIAALAALPFADDPMNDDMSLTRNRVRLAILPRLRELNPQVEAALARTATLLERDSRFLDELAPELGDSRSVPLAVVTTLPRPVADRVLRAVLVASGVGPTADRIERMWSVASGQSERQDLADGRVATTSGALLVVE